MGLINSVFLSLGSNLGDRYFNLQNAVSEISNQIGKITAISPIYETEPIGFSSTELFLNVCVQIESSKSAFQILEILQEIEIKAGRISSQNQGYISRIIDIDIIFYNQETIKADKLTVPHASFRDRLFVLLPLNDLNSQFVDPKTSLTIKQLMDKCTENSKLVKIKLLLNF
jgi:deoxyguanosine kinase